MGSDELTDTPEPQWGTASRGSHEVRVDTEIPRSKPRYQPACTCGWTGGWSTSIKLAIADNMLHLNHELFPA